MTLIRQLGGSHRRSPALAGVISVAVGALVACSFDGGGVMFVDGATVCGDGVVQSGEACDKLDLAGQSCASLTGDDDGTVTCTQDCTFDISACHTCGDGEREGDAEECDGADLDGDCLSLGHSGGELTCSDACAVDDRGCFDAPADWYDLDWGYRLPISISREKVDGDLAGFPVLIDLGNGELTGKAQATAADVLFTTDNGTSKLSHEVELYDPGSGRLIAWVNVPVLSASADTLIYVYYGNGECAAQEAAALVWSGHHGVWHLGEASVDEHADAVHLDSSVSANHGSQTGNGRAPGKVGFGQSFDGDDDEITISNSDSFALGDASATVSAWIKTSSVVEMGIMVKSPVDSHIANDKLFGVNHTEGKLGVDQGWVDYLAGTSDITDDIWHQVVWVQRRDAAGDQELWELWVDGVKEGEKHATTSADVLGHIVRLGGAVPDSYFPNRWRGFLDEVRVSHVARGRDWIKASFANQHQPNVFYFVGPEQTF